MPDPIGPEPEQQQFPQKWRLWWQDYRYHVPGVGKKKPEKQFRDFPTKDLAEAAKARLPSSSDVIACVTRAPPPRKKKQAA